MIRLTWLAVCLGLSVGCGPSVAVQGGGTDEGADADVDSSGTGSVSASGGAMGTADGGTIDLLDTGDSDDATDDSGGATFLEPPDGCGDLPPGTIGHCTPIKCSLFDQDCPDGEKCMPWASDGGGSWNDTRCSPVAEPAAALGEACEVEGSGVSGLDNCELGAMCFYVDAQTNAGTCVSLCEGNEEAPICPPQSQCSITGDGVLTICIPTCDPLANDCDEGQTCVPDDDVFSCAPGIVDAATEGDPCEFVNACESGLVCVSALATSCPEGNGCCSSFCDLSGVDPQLQCTNPLQVCAPWYRDGTAPDGLGNVGVCTQPTR